MQADKQSIQQRHRKLVSFVKCSSKIAYKSKRLEKSATKLDTSIYETIGTYPTYRHMPKQKNQCPISYRSIEVGNSKKLHRNKKQNYSKSRIDIKRYNQCNNQVEEKIKSSALIQAYQQQLLIVSKRNNSQQIVNMKNKKPSSGSQLSAQHSFHKKIKAQRLNENQTKLQGNKNNKNQKSKRLLPFNLQFKNNSENEIKCGKFKSQKQIYEITGQNPIQNQKEDEKSIARSQNLIFKSKFQHKVMFNNKKIKSVNSARQVASQFHEQDSINLKSKERIIQKQGKYLIVQSARNISSMGSLNLDDSEKINLKVLKNQIKAKKKPRRHLTEISNCFQHNAEKISIKNIETKSLPKGENKSIQKQNFLMANKKDHRLKQQIADISDIVQQNKYGYSNEQSILQNIGELDTLLSDYLITQGQSKISVFNHNSNPNQCPSQIQDKNFEKPSMTKKNRDIQKTTTKSKECKKLLLSSLATLSNAQNCESQGLNLIKNYESQYYRSHRYLPLQSQNITQNLYFCNKNNKQTKKYQNINANIKKLKQFKDFKTNSLVLKSIDRVKHIFPKGFF